MTGETNKCWCCSVEFLRFRFLYRIGFLVIVWLSASWLQAAFPKDWECSIFMV